MRRTLRRSSLPLLPPERPSSLRRHPGHVPWMGRPSTSSRSNLIQKTPPSATSSINVRTADSRSPRCLRVCSLPGHMRSRSPTTSSGCRTGPRTRCTTSAQHLRWRERPPRIVSPCGAPCWPTVSGWSRISRNAHGRPGEARNRLHRIAGDLDGYRSAGDSRSKPRRTAASGDRANWRKNLVRVYYLPQ